MQINDLRRSIGATKGSTTSIAGLGNKELPEQLRQLSKGATFEGTIVGTKDGKVIIGLSNGQQIAATMEQGISLVKGQTLYFEVNSSSSANQLSIRPMSQEDGSNSSVIKALQAAGLAASESNIEMVKEMMNHQMPIDKQSLMLISKTLLDYPKLSTQSAVEMTKYEIPINPTNIDQYEHYKIDQQSMMKDMNEVITNLQNLFSEEGINSRELEKLNRQLFEIFTSVQSQSEVKPLVQNEIEGILNISENEIEQLQEQRNERESALNIRNGELEDQNGTERSQLENSLNNEKVSNQSTISSFTVGKIDPEAKALVEIIAQEIEEGKVINEQERVVEKFVHHLSQELTNISSGQSSLKGTDLLEQVGKFLEQGNFTENHLKGLLNSLEYRDVLKAVVEQNWLLEPSDVAKEGEISKVYERIQDQISKLDNMASQSGREVTQLQQSVGHIKDNISFIQNVNQMYNYIQIPLLLSGKHQSGDLYVYTNKKALMKDNGEISAHLHLDMPYLGVTDVAVKMSNKQLTTNFVMENEESFDLVMAHIDQLTNRLQDKGYSVNMDVSKAEKSYNFVQDFLGKEEKMIAKPTAHYSFDVRA